MKRRDEIEGMSGTPRPLAPLIPGKLKLKKSFVREDSSSAAALTVLPSNRLVESADKGPPPNFKGNIPVVEGVFRRGALVGKVSIVAPGPSAPKRKLSQKERLERRLDENSDEENENELTAAAVEEAPKPPPQPSKPLVTVAKPKEALPAVAKAFLEGAVNAEPTAKKSKSYDLDVVKYRLTEELVGTLLELNEQLGQLLGLSLEEKTGFTKQKDPVDGLAHYVFDDEQQFVEPLTNERLIALDSLFPTFKLRMDSFYAKEDKLDAELNLLFKLLAFAPKYEAQKSKLDKKQREKVLKDMLTPRIADTLLELKESLDGLHEAGISLADMKITEPEEGRPHVYEFDDGNTFMPVEATAESRKEQEKRLEELDAFFNGGSKIRLDKIIGFGPFDQEGTPLQRDLDTLNDLLGFAQEYKDRLGKREAKAAAVAEEAKALEATDLAGTPFEELAGPIEAERTKSPYEVTDTSDYTPLKHDSKDGEITLPKQKGFIPQTRRAFGYFIFDKFQNYRLKALEKLDPNACAAMGDSSSATQIYEYQKFVRDYVSFMTPYRGVLVYHGLGSGKTCTAIAASEALFASGGKGRVVVMTPFSLRKNFIQQITFCGFRHFRLLNYWVPYEYNPKEGKNALYLFATSVMRIPASYFAGKGSKVTRIWIPDLSKEPSEENYSKDLTSDQRNEIRNQIYETLIYDKEKGKHGMIEFINYNGITATKLKKFACEEGYFDNCVIVVDEIHNLVRLMQGTIDPYLKKLFLNELKGAKKTMDPDKITSEPWKPKYCNKSMNYKRGYLFYRLLIGAKNTKIVGLSGTPLINFPEELGILANILHGYNFVYKASIPKLTQAGGNERFITALKEMAEGEDKENFCPDLDFYEIVPSAREPKIEFTFTFLPEGYRKVQGQLGVERIPFTETLEPTNTKIEMVEACITKALQKAGSTAPYKGITETAEPLLPVMGEPSDATSKTLDDSFKGRFVNPADGTSIINAQILFKRLSGLISYYKGSRKDLMPEVVEDTVVQVPMSLEQQKKYVLIRLAEIKVEQKKEKEKRKGGPVDAAAIRGDDAELKKLSSSQNYRMASRQACNFVFPDGFTRPRPMTAEQIKQADEFGGSVDDLVGDDQSGEASALVGTREEEAAAAETDRREAEEARVADEAVSRAEEEGELKAKREELTAKGASAAVIEAELQAIRARYEERRVGEVVVASDVPEEELAESLSAQQKRCLANQLPGESYQAAILRAKNCLLTLGLSKLALQDPDHPDQSPLEKCSPKYKAILEKLEEIPGSSLVYSQFLGMEGIGIFTIAMRANGYKPIVIQAKEGSYAFDEETEASIRKGPSVKEPRFILFTGGESEEIRKINIDLFNAKLSELPAGIRSVLEESGFTSEIGNKRGELCRVFCITAAGAEGLSLKNVRGVHIMEPYWNDVRMAQVKGRAVRICSHQDLPLKDRNVRIFTYVTVFSTEAQSTRGDPREGERMKWAIPQEIWNRDGINRATAESYGISITRDDYAMTSDERLYYISEKKKKLVNNLVILMKSAAADCLLNYEQNKDGTFMCRMLGNEGDFMYHPNLQRDIETSKSDVLGDLFTVPEEEQARVRAAQAKLVFEERKEEEKEAETETEEEEEEEEEAPPPPPKVDEAAAPKPKTAVAPPPPKTAAKPAAGRIQYKLLLRLDPKSDKKTEFLAVGTPKGDGYVFFLFDSADTTFAKPLYKADGILAGTKWQPKPPFKKL